MLRWKDVPCQSKMNKTVKLRYEGRTNKRLFKGEGRTKKILLYYDSIVTPNSKNTIPQFNDP